MEKESAEEVPQKRRKPPRVIEVASRYSQSSQNKQPATARSNSNASTAQLNRAGKKMGGNKESQSLGRVSTVGTPLAKERRSSLKVSQSRHAQPTSVLAESKNTPRARSTPQVPASRSRQSVASRYRSSNPAKLPKESNFKGSAGGVGVGTATRQGGGARSAAAAAAAAATARPKTAGGAAPAAAAAAARGRAGAAGAAAAGARGAAGGGGGKGRGEAGGGAAPLWAWENLLLQLRWVRLGIEGAAADRARREEAELHGAWALVAGLEEGLGARARGRRQRQHVARVHAALAQQAAAAAGARAALPGARAALAALAAALTLSQECVPVGEGWGPAAAGGGGGGGGGAAALARVLRAAGPAAAAVAGAAGPAAERAEEFAALLQQMQETKVEMDILLEETKLDCEKAEHASIEERSLLLSLAEKFMEQYHVKNLQQ